MEKRLLLAFALSMALILTYQVFFYMPRMRAYEEARKARLAEEQLNAPLSGDTLTRGPEPDTLVASAPGAAPSPTAGPADEGYPVVAPGGAKVVTVRTSLSEIVLTTAGAELVSAKLAKFETGGQPVELIARDDTPAMGGMANVALVGEARTLPISGIAFDAFLEGRQAPLEDGAVLVVDIDTPETQLTFRATRADGGVIERYYRFAHDSYVIQSGVRFRAAQFPFVRSIRWGLGPGLRPTEANVAEDYAAFRASLRIGEEYYRKKLGTFDESHPGMVHWAALQVKYFTAAVISPSPAGGEARFQAKKADGFMTASIDLPVSDRQGRVDQAVELYLGPIDFGLLKALGQGLEKNVEMGHKYFRPVSSAVLWGLLKLHKVIPNYGLVIILLSVFTKVLFYRLTHKSFKSMRDMQALQPKLQALKEKYKSDRQKLSQETMKLYKEAGVNPLGGCLPMLLQMPVFIALFNVLRNTIELRQAPFIGWMNDLSQQDVLFRLPAGLPLIGNAVSVLPILMGAGMLVQSKIGGSIAGPESSPSQSKAFQYMMPVVFTFLFYKMPSGLVLYWLVNTVASIGQQYYINKGAEQREREKNNESAKTSG